MALKREPEFKKETLALKRVMEKHQIGTETSFGREKKRTNEIHVFIPYSFIAW